MVADLCNMPYPELSIGIITYNRRDQFLTVLKSILENALYPEYRLHFVLSSDGGEAHEYIEEGKALVGDDSRVTLLRNDRLGMGGNWNRMIAAAHTRANFVLCCQDDWLFTEPVDLRVAVRFLQYNQKYGMVRYHKLSGHEGLVAVVKQWDTRGVFRNFVDSPYEYLPALMTFLELLPPFDNSNTYSPYSGGVHLRTVNFTNAYGEYPEGARFSHSELAHFEKVNGGLRANLNVMPRIALFPHYVQSRFHDIGQSFRDTDVEKETLKANA